MPAALDDQAQPILPGESNAGSDIAGMVRLNGTGTIASPRQQGDSDRPMLAALRYAIRGTD